MSPLRVAVSAPTSAKRGGRAWTAWPSDCWRRSTAAHRGRRVDVTAVCPPFARRATRFSSGGPGATNLDRGLNRLVDYPRHVGAIAAAYDVFHIVDHSYSQLVHRLPAGADRRHLPRSRYVPVDASSRTRSRGRRLPGMTRHILSGFSAPPVVTCDTAAVRDELVARRVVRGREPRDRRAGRRRRRVLAGPRRRRRSRRRTSGRRARRARSRSSTSAARRRASASTCC